MTEVIMIMVHIANLDMFIDRTGYPGVVGGAGVVGVVGRVGQRWWW